MGTILVTGGAGFIGSHTCLLLLQKGYKIVVLDSLINSSKISLERVSKIVCNKLDIERTSRMKAKLRGKPATDDDIRFVVQRYLTGENVSSIASSMYRSPAFVKSIIKKIGVPMKLPEGDYEGRRTAMLPDQCVADEFKGGEVVWAIRKNYPAKIVREITPEHQAANAGYACYGDITKCVNNDESKGQSFNL